MRAELRVDEGALERLMSAGVLDREGDDPEEEEEGRRDSEEEATLSDTPTEESEDSRNGRLRRSWRKVWRKISGKSSQQRNTDGGFLKKIFY